MREVCVCCVLVVAVVWKVVTADGRSGVATCLLRESDLATPCEGRSECRRDEDCAIGLHCCQTPNACHLCLPRDRVIGPQQEQQEESPVNDEEGWPAEVDEGMLEEIYQRLVQEEREEKEKEQVKEQEEVKRAKVPIFSPSVGQKEVVPPEFNQKVEIAIPGMQLGDHDHGFVDHGHDPDAAGMTAAGSHGYGEGEYGGGLVDHTYDTAGRVPVAAAQRAEAPAVSAQEGADGTAGGLDKVVFILIVAACSVAASSGLVAAGICWYRLHRNAKSAADTDYPAYGVTGPSGGNNSNEQREQRSGSAGDRKLAQSAQMYHYQHQKQQMIAMEKASGEMKTGEDSQCESEEENEEGDYTVYECPGLASTGEMTVKNPLFNEDTPAVAAAAPAAAKKE